MGLFKKIFFRDKPLICNHEWKPATIRQLRIEDGKIITYTIETFQMLECKKCAKTKRLF
jgi:hypothetical protein